MVENYLEQVYAGVLGKVIGVYMGRPFEGWKKEKIIAKWGRIDRYVHEEQNMSRPCPVCGGTVSIEKLPLVVADDDITGTFTFIRALEDSGLYEKTPGEFFGETWLNYLIENQTILWWGGMGVSTEHTAYLRLKNGVKAPRSGSIELNGRTVAEQIGAQIFIDAFGLVTPGKPELAAQLAAKAGSVSHDGESVYAAQVVAAMVSAAFVEKKMEKLLDIGLGVIPESCLIAQVHRDVRKWSSQNKNWEETFKKIDEKYGYHKYGGNCHVIPNHGIMVMAWCYAPDDFHQAQVIINTAGWDTDCNAANVGSVMGLVVGRERINEKYEFQKPFADRMVLPTADGSRGVSDCLLEARYIAAIGRKIMGWPAEKPLGSWHDFGISGALHGYAVETANFSGRDNATLCNIADPKDSGNRLLQVNFDVDTSRFARISTPINPEPFRGAYNVMAASRVYPGNTVTLEFSCGEIFGKSTARLFVRELSQGQLYYSEPSELIANTGQTATFDIPATQSNQVKDFGLEIVSSQRSSGTIFVDSTSIGGKAKFTISDPLYKTSREDLRGFVFDADVVRGRTSDDTEDLTYVTKNEGRGELSFGTDDWRDYQFKSRIKVHIADRAGIFVRYRGKKRYTALELTEGKLRLILRNYDETVLAETPCDYELDVFYGMELRCEGKNISAWFEGEKLLEGIDDQLGCGGAGVFYENGTIGFRELTIS